MSHKQLGGEDRLSFVPLMLYPPHQERLIELHCADGKSPLVVEKTRFNSLDCKRRYGPIEASQFESFEAAGGS
jgi:hypothetical protein